MPKCDFNKVPKQLYWNYTLSWVFSCNFAVYFQNNFSYEHLWTAASVYYMVCCQFPINFIIFQNPQPRNDANFYRMFSGLPCFVNRMDSYFNASILSNLSFKNVLYFLLLFLWYGNSNVSYLTVCVKVFFTPNI